MDYIRSFDNGAFAADRFDFQVLADLETCYVIVCRSPVGEGGPATHIHDCDEMYYMLDGAMTLLASDVEYAAGPESLVFIPRGTPHRNWTSASPRGPPGHPPSAAPARRANVPSAQPRPARAGRARHLPGSPGAPGGEARANRP